MHKGIWVVVGAVFVTSCSQSDDAGQQSVPAADAGLDGDGSATDGPVADGSGGKDSGSPDGGDAGDALDHEAGDGAAEAMPDGPAPPPTVLLPRAGIDAAELVVLINDDDPQSVAVAAHYQAARGIPAANMIHLKAPVANNWPRADFLTVKAQVDAAIPAGTQAYAISWTKPYLVDCMSVVAAFALGFDEKYCNTVGGCQPTALVNYFDSDSTTPWTDHQIRPAMMLVGADQDKANAVVDRGVLADATFPKGDGYLMRTTDKARSVRYGDFQSAVSQWNHADGLTLTYLDNSSGSGDDFIKDKTNVLFYLTGLASVPSIETNQYLPGAVADHLTSYGGQVPTSGQMSIAKWLEAGATASFGTVVEPCNYTQKFPQATVLLEHYFRGETILEAYWKSVHMPGEGNFAGEPLARPWGSKSQFSAGTLEILTTILQPGKVYELRSAPSDAGPWQIAVGNIEVTQYQFKTITVQDAKAAYYKLAEQAKD
jgi:uncharacterized protein (TIGR03790 family)